MSDKHLPIYGYQFDRIAVLEQSYKWKTDEEVKQSGEDRRLAFFWNWFLIDEAQFYVVLGCRLFPSPEHPAEVTVAMVGDFTISADEPSVPVQEFVYRTAPQIMFPYVREVVSTITSRGMAGVYHIPPFDVADVIANDFKFEEAQGTRDLSQNPELAAKLGVPLPRKSAARKRNQIAKPQVSSTTSSGSKRTKKS